MVTREIQYIYFHNDSDLPVIVEGWQNTKSGISALVETRVEPRQQLIVHSTVGEWHMNSMFYDDKDIERWKGLEKHSIIGKFRSRPCASGNYSWLEYDEPFRCVFTDITEEDLNKIDAPNKNKITGKITFSMT